MGSSPPRPNKSEDYQIYRFFYFYNRINRFDYSVFENSIRLYYKDTIKSFKNLSNFDEMNDIHNSKLTVYETKIFEIKHYYGIITTQYLKEVHNYPEITGRNFIDKFKKENIKNIPSNLSKDNLRDIQDLYSHLEVLPSEKNLDKTRYNNKKVVPTEKYINEKHPSSEQILTNRNPGDTQDIDQNQPGPFFENNFTYISPFINSNDKQVNLHPDSINEKPAVSFKTRGSPDYKVILFHATGEKAGPVIREQGKMIPGRGGKFGGGIYFADSPTICYRKTLNGDTYLVKARVKLGVSLCLDEWIWDLTYEKLKKEYGCDSVISDYYQEFIAYRSEDVEVIEVIDVNREEEKIVQLIKEKQSYLDKISKSINDPFIHLAKADLHIAQMFTKPSIDIGNCRLYLIKYQNNSQEQIENIYGEGYYFRLKPEVNFQKNELLNIEVYDCNLTILFIDKNRKLMKKNKPILYVNEHSEYSIFIPSVSFFTINKTYQSFSKREVYESFINEQKEYTQKNPNDHFAFLSYMHIISNISQYIGDLKQNLNTILRNPNIFYNIREPGCLKEGSFHELSYEGKFGRYETLYHLTNFQGAEGIGNSKSMRPGRKGMLGPGIYFAESAEICLKKTENGSDYLVTAKVHVGKSLVVHAHDPSICCEFSYDKLQEKHECDSVTAKKGMNQMDKWRPRLGAKEYCVYRSEDVEVIDIVNYKELRKDKKIGDKFVERQKKIIAYVYAKDLNNEEIKAKIDEKVAALEMIQKQNFVRSRIFYAVQVDKKVSKIENGKYGRGVYLSLEPPRYRFKNDKIIRVQVNEANVVNLAEEENIDKKDSEGKVICYMNESKEKMAFIPENYEREINYKIDDYHLDEGGIENFKQNEVRYFETNKEDIVSKVNFTRFMKSLEVKEMNSGFSGIFNTLNRIMENENIKRKVLSP